MLAFAYGYVPNFCWICMDLQESAAFLLHPESPTKRLLVDHATGTGKVWQG
jgi:hypothetical protein